MFSSPSGLLCEREEHLYDDPSAWHNTFYRDVTSNIDEEIFKPLYTTENDGNRVGHPNVSIHILVAMIILKEGISCSDEQLYEHCRFNLLYRRALGMVTLDEQCSTIDSEAEYRGKNKQRVKGFVTNITETVLENGKPSLITDVKVKGATAADNDFFEEAVKETEKVTDDDVENAYVDGAYQSEKNREFAKDKINIISGVLQGKPSRFDLNLKDDQTLEVTDKTTGEIKTAIPVKPDEWKIVLENADGKKSYRYFKKEHVDKAEVRRKVESIPFEERKKRNNVEAAMFQYGFHTRNNKTRYCTVFKHGLQAIARCAWMNMRRLFWFDNKLSLQIAK